MDDVERGLVSVGDSEDVIYCDYCHSAGLRPFEVKNDLGMFCSQSCADEAEYSYLTSKAARSGLLDFEAFQASKVEVDSVLEYDGQNDDPGMVYAGLGLYIVKTDNWDAGLRENGKYYLIIGNGEYQSDMLYDLEWALYRYYVGEYGVDEPGEKVE